MQTTLARGLIRVVAVMPFAVGTLAASEPSIHHGQPISDLRAQLVRDGWTPVRIDQKTGGERENLMASARIFFEAGYFEVEGCSGTGLNYCIFNYQKNGQCLRIITQGETDPQVDKWTTDCPG